MEIKPIHGYVFAEILPPDMMSAGGIHLPGKETQKAEKARVVDVGTGLLTESGNVIPLAIKKDDVIIFNQYAGMRFEDDGKEFIILKETEIFGTTSYEEPTPEVIGVDAGVSVKVS